MSKEYSIFVKCWAQGILAYGQIGGLKEVEYLPLSLWMVSRVEIAVVCDIKFSLNVIHVVCRNSIYVVQFCQVIVTLEG